MTREQRRIRDHWFAAVLHAIWLHDESAAYLLTLAFVQRLREIGALEAPEGTKETR